MSDSRHFLHHMNEICANSQLWSKRSVKAGISPISHMIDGHYVRPEPVGLMFQPQQRACQNRLLAALSATDFALLQPHLELVTLSVGDVLIRADTPIRRVAFVEQGIVSLISMTRDAQQIEAGLVGREGMVGVPVLLDAEQTPNEARVQMLGLAWTMSASALKDALGQSPDLQRRLLRYAHVFAVQLASTALANGRFKLEPRLARWLLMCHDRTTGNTLPTTHQFLSLMLGVNRTTLTAVVAEFERSGSIETQRGTLIVRHRPTLHALAGACYGVPEAEYARLLGREADDEAAPQRG